MSWCHLMPQLFGFSMPKLVISLRITSTCFSMTEISSRSSCSTQSSAATSLGLRSSQTISDSSDSLFWFWRMRLLAWLWNRNINPLFVRISSFNHSARFFHWGNSSWNRLIPLDWSFSKIYGWLSICVLVTYHRYVTFGSWISLLGSILFSDKSSMLRSNISFSISYRCFFCSLRIVSSMTLSLWDESMLVNDILVSTLESLRVLNLSATRFLYVSCVITFFTIFLI